MWSEDLPLSLSSDPASEYCGDTYVSLRAAAGKDQDFAAMAGSLGMECRMYYGGEEGNFGK